MIASDSALVGGEQPAIEQARDSMYPGEQLMGEPTGCDVALVLVGAGEGTSVGLPAIGHHRRARLDVRGKERSERLRRGVGEHRQATAPETPRLPVLDTDADQDLLARRSSTFAAGAHAAEQGLVHLNDSVQALSPRLHEDRAQTMEHCPGRLHRADLEHSLKAQRRDAVLRSRELPARVEPHRERGARPVEDGAGRHRRPSTAGGALHPTVAQSPAASATAHGAHEPRRPPHPRQIVEAVSVGREPCVELPDGSGVVHATLGLFHVNRLVRLSGKALEAINPPLTPSLPVKRLSG